MRTLKILTALASLAVLHVACRPGSAQTVTPANPQAPQAAGESVEKEQPDQPVPAMVLRSDEAVKDMAGQAGTAYYFQIYVAPDADRLVVNTSGGQGDVDLYLSYGRLPEPDQYDYVSNHEGTAEKISLRNPRAGTWYAMVFGYEDFRNVSLVGSWYQDAQAGYYTSYYDTYVPGAVVGLDWTTVEYVPVVRYVVLWDRPCLWRHWVHRFRDFFDYDGHHHVKHVIVRPRRAIYHTSATAHYLPRIIRRPGAIGHAGTIGPRADFRRLPGAIDRGRRDADGRRPLFARPDGRGPTATFDRQAPRIDRQAGGRRDVAGPSWSALDRTAPTTDRRSDSPTRSRRQGDAERNRPTFTWPTRQPGRTADQPPRFTTEPVRPNVTPVRPNVTPVRPNVTPVRPNVTPVRPSGESSRRSRSSGIFPSRGSSDRPTATPVRPSGESSRRSRSSGIFPSRGSSDRPSATPPRIFSTRPQAAPDRGGREPSRAPRFTVPERSASPSRSSPQFEHRSSGADRGSEHARPDHSGGRSGSDGRSTDRGSSSRSRR